MQKSSISIRQAIKSDAPFIAQAVAMAIGDENAIKNYCGEDYITLLTHIAENEKSQYSYINTLIAEIDGNAAGAVVGYNGAMLHELRATTYSIIYNELGRTPSIPDETEAGEFYLDSLAVLPAYRCQGIASRLLKATAAKALAMGIPQVGLLVDKGNPAGERLYVSNGFHYANDAQWGGHPMKHMVMTVNEEMQDTNHCI